MQAITPERCKGCGCRLTFTRSGRPIKDHPQAICEHLTISKPCAASYFEAGLCVVFDGKEIVADSIHVLDDDGIYRVRAADRFGRMTHFGKTKNFYHAAKKTEVMKRCRSIQTSKPAWRG